MDLPDGPAGESFARPPGMRTLPYMHAWTFIAALILAMAGMCAAAEEEVRQWQPAEFVFEAQDEYARPLEQVDLSIAFTGPAGESFRAVAFWDGGKIWKVRFTPTRPGKWSFRAAANVADAGLANRSGTFTAKPAAGDNPLHRHGGILEVSADGRYLTHSDGTPFFWLGDTWWFCPSDLVPIDGSTKAHCDSMYKTLIDKRRSQGFSVVQMAFLGKLNQSRGVNSFMSLRQERSLDIACWQQVDRYIRYANDAGIVPVIGMAFHAGLDSNSLEDWKFLWRYVVARYGAHAVTWLICGEYNLDSGNTAGRVAKALALGAFIREIDPYKRAMTVHPWYYGGDKRQAWKEPWYDFIMFQGGHVGHGKVPPTRIYTEAWEHKPARPLLESECNYEGIYAGKPGKEQTADDVRRVAYHAIQAGSFGYTYGAQGLWYPTQNAEDKTFSDWGEPMVWWEAMNRPGAAQMQHLRKCYESVEWWKLIPRPGAVIIDGKSTDATRPLAKSDEDKTCIVWFPQGSSAKSAAWWRLLDRSGRGVYAATWFNPRTGQNTAISTPLAATEGACPLPPRPDEEDWVRLLRAALGSAE